MCAAAVYTLPPVIVSRPIYRQVRVLDTQDLPKGIVWVHIKLNVPPKVHYMKLATTIDHDDRGTPDMSRGCLPLVLLCCRACNGQRQWQAMEQLTPHTLWEGEESWTVCV